MAPQSTAKYVSYGLRPAKQCERKLMLETFRVAMECGFPIPDYRYVGMGGNRFYDFLLMHKTFGITRMVSLEHDRKMMPRAVFNNPYKFIEVLPVSSQDFIFSDEFTGPSIYWMDYDCRISQGIIDDIGSLGRKVTPGDFVFFTVCGDIPRRFDGVSGQRRLLDVREIFGDFANDLDVEDMENANFPSTVHQIMNKALQHTFVVRRDGTFQILFQVEYADGVNMITVGGVFSDSSKCGKLVKRLQERIPFLSTKPLTRYCIRRFDLTEKERDLFDRAATAKRLNAKELNELKRLRFRDRELESYRELLRYHPRYVETLL